MVKMQTRIRLLILFVIKIARITNTEEKHNFVLNFCKNADYDNWKLIL